MKACDFIWSHLAAEAKVRPPHCFMTWHAMAERGKDFNPSAFATFAGLELKHVEAIIETFARNNVVPKVEKEKPVSTRGRRLPPDFSIPDDWKRFARNERGWVDDVIDRIGSQFVDYWHAKSGKDAVKLDWLATWRNWVRNSNEPTGTARDTPEPSDRQSYYRDQAARLRRIGRDDAAMDFEKLAEKLIRQSDETVIPFRATGR